MKAAKRLVGVLLAAALAVTASVSVFAAEDPKFTTAPFEGGVAITGVSTTKTDIIIPNSIGGQVLKISKQAFDRKKLTNVILPTTLKIIETQAFYWNELTNLTIPDSVESIGKMAFLGNKLHTVFLSSKLTEIGDSSFSGNAIEEIVLPPSVTSIGMSAFSKNKLKSIDLTNVLNIGEMAFHQNELISITLPEGMTQIPSSTFASNQLTSLNIPNSVQTIGGSAFSQNQLTSVSIPDSVQTIEGSAFYSNQLTSLKIPASVQTIGSVAFNNNQLPDHQAFICKPDDSSTIVSYGGAKRDNVVIPETITTIGEYSFSRNNLTSVQIPSSVTTIENNAFGVNQLATITIPKNVTKIGNSAFANAFGTNPENAKIYLEGRTSTVGMQLGSTWNGTAQIIYGSAPDTKVTGINAADLSVKKGETGTIGATVTPADAKDKTLTYVSQNEAVATVNQSGTVTGVSAGTAPIKITANDGSGIEKTITVTVTEDAVPPVDPPEGSDSANVDVNGSIKPISTLDVDVPISSSFLINEARDFVSAEFEVVNNSPVPVTVTAESLSAKVGTKTKVVPESAYTSKAWNNLSTSQTQTQIALGLRTVGSSSALVKASAPETKWFGADGALSNLELGVIESAFGADQPPKMTLDFDAMYGKAWGNVNSISYDLVLTFSVD